MVPMRHTVLVFAGLDPSGGAGLAADIVSIAAQGAHALPVITALTVQDNDRVFGVEAVAPELLRRQAQALIDKMAIHAVKIGIPGSAANAAVIAQLIAQLRLARPGLPVVLDPVLASGHGDVLSRDDAVPTPASTSTGTFAWSMIRDKFHGFKMPMPEPIREASGMTATQPMSSRIFAWIGSSLQ